MVSSAADASLMVDLSAGSSQRRSRSRSPERNRSRKVSRSPSQEKRSRRSASREDARSSFKRRRTDSYDSSSSHSQSPPPGRNPATEKWLSKIPEEQVKFVKAVAGKVKDHGKGFEDTLKEREKANPKFAFLIDDKVSCFEEA
jgi:U2-associated protein SR140